MKKRIRLFSTVLSILTLFSVAFSAGCNSGENSQSTSNSSEQSDSSNVKVELNAQGIVEKGRSDYKLVIADGSSSVIETAVVEFNTFFSEATRIELSVVTDAEVAYNEDAQYISLGKNQVQEAAGVKLDEDMTKAGSFVIDTVGNSVFVLGLDEYGTLYGVYELLHHLVGFEYYGQEMYALDNNVAKIPLYDFNVKEVPDYEIRQTGYGQRLSPDIQALNRLRYQNTRTDLAIGSSLGHTSMNFLPLTKYFDQANNPDNYHPEWYMLSTAPTQLCYTARGNETYFEEMVSAAFDTLKYEMIKQPTATGVNFSMSDDGNWCSCDGCNESKTKYGSVTGAVIKFLNRLTEMAYDWMETEEGKPYARDLVIFFYAYQQLEGAPVKLNEQTGKYELIHQDVKMNEHVIPQLCLTQANYTVSLKTHMKNKTAYENIQKWSAVSDNLYTYLYASNYRIWLMPYDTFNAMQEWYQTYYEHGATLMYNLGHGGEPGMATGFNNLKIYLDSKLSWDVYADYDKLIKDFFDNVYKEASPYLYEIFNDFRVLSEYNKNNYADVYLTSVINAGPYYMLSNIWPKSLLLGWRTKFDDALNAVAYMKESNPEQYAITYKYIVTERIWVDYALYKIYFDELTLTEQQKLKLELYNDLVIADIRYEKEGGSVDGLKAELLG